jgi:hypothetical protein
MMGSKSGERCDISATDIPDEPYETISAAARSSTGRGSIEGPAEKLKTLSIFCSPLEKNKDYIHYISNSLTSQSVKAKNINKKVTHRRQFLHK